MRISEMSKGRMASRLPGVSASTVGGWASVNYAFMGVVTLVVLLVFIFTSSTTSQTEEKLQSYGGVSSNSSPKHDNTASDIDILEGVIADTPYLYCKNERSMAINHDLILLHGSAFTKETWQSSNILQQFCRHDSITSVTALDFDVSWKSDKLVEVLRALITDIKVGMPVRAIVTPSAGATPIIDWIELGQVSTVMGKYISSWIPVASNGVMKIPESSNVWNQVRQSNVKILAIYGDKDKGGESSMKMLKDRLGPNTKLEEMPGRHPCYLDSPDLFVSTVAAFMKEIQD